MTDAHIVLFCCSPTIYGTACTACSEVFSGICFHHYCMHSRSTLGLKHNGQETNEHMLTGYVKPMRMMTTAGLKLLCQ